MSSSRRCRHISMTYIHPITLQQLAADREARLRHQANVRRRIRRLRRRLADCA